MLTEKEIEELRKELVQVRSSMEAIGPMVFGTMAPSRKKYRTKDGKERFCADSAGAQVRQPAGGDPPAAGADRGAGETAGGMSGSDTIAYCLTPNPCAIF